MHELAVEVVVIVKDWDDDHLLALATHFHEREDLHHAPKRRDARKVKRCGGDAG